ncbi:MAG: regulator of sirC expression with transglutaminase-like and TPR domain [Acidimicrobiales bacterium]|jgi:regulator of sirC expression with transglutaminase-like and TPR domain
MTEALASQMGRLFAKGARPTLDLVTSVIAGLATPAGEADNIVATFDALAADAPSSATTAAGVIDYVFGDLGFAGNHRNYYDVNNSYMHSVLERRVGIPITLSAVTIEIGRRLGVGFEPIGFPGHLLIRSGEMFFDPFAAGNSLGLDDCQSLLQQMYPGATLEPEHTAVLSTAQVGHRMINNLKQIELSSGNLSGVIDVCLIGLALPGSDASHRAELAKLFEVTGRHDQAANMHEELATLDPKEASFHQQAAGRLRTNRN